MTDEAVEGTRRSEGVSPAEEHGGAAGPDPATAAAREAADGGSPNGRAPGATRTGLVGLFQRLVTAIRQGDDDQVENAVLSLSRRNRFLAPLALLVGAFAVLFQGIRLLLTNWRLTLIQILPAMWIWLAMLDLKVHVLHGKQFNVVRGPLLVPLLLAVVAITSAAFFLNAVFGFAIAQSGSNKPEIRPAYEEARSHIGIILAWGAVIGTALGFSALWVTRWGLGWFTVAFGIMTGVMMFAYVALPSRMLGLRPEMSRRDKLTTSAVGGAVGVVVCSPPYWLGRLAIIMLGSAALRVPAVIILVIAVLFQTGATSAIKAVKMSAKIVAGRASAESEADTSAGAVSVVSGAVAVPPMVAPVAELSTEPGVASPDTGVAT